MKDKSKLIKRLLFGGILAVISLPMIMTFFPLISIDPLNGFFAEPQRPQLSRDNWFTGQYQDSMELFINDKTGGRPFLVRINNQLDYSVFGKANVSNVVIGKEHYLYEQSYIDAYLGTDFIGRDSIAEKVRKLKTVSDTLMTRGIPLIVLLAPGKASFFPEYLPEGIKAKRGRTNHSVYKEFLAQNNIFTLDFKTWFIEQKETSNYALFPKGGIHWSSYGEVLAADSLIRFLNQITPNSQINTIRIKKIHPSRIAYNRDEDIEESMNLLLNLENNLMGYPEFEAIAHSAKKTTRVLTIADSYFWGMYDWGLSRNYFGNGSFWYYNKQMYPESFEKETFVQNLPDLAHEVEKNDAILLLFTDANLKDFAYGFIDRLYDEYCNDGRRKREERIAKIIQDIRNTPEWLKSIEKKAKSKGISLDEALRENAVYILQQEN